MRMCVTHILVQASGIDLYTFSLRDDYFENLLKAAGIRSPFEVGCMKEIVDKLKKKIN